MSDGPSADLLREFTATFNTRDLDAVMNYFTDDAVFESPRGPDPWGTRFEGRERVREAWPPDSRDCPSSTTARTTISWSATAAPPSGRCVGRRPTANESRSEAATCGPSATA